MEDFTEVKLLDPGPMYFFDQMKPKKKKWEKKDLLPHLEHISEANQRIGQTGSGVSISYPDAPTSKPEEQPENQRNHPEISTGDQRESTLTTTRGEQSLHRARLKRSMHSKESKELEKGARLPRVAALEEKYESHSFSISPTPVVSKFPTSVRFSKEYMQKSLFEEYKLIAAKILCELGETLQIYTEYKIAIPVGVVNLVNYSWHDLIDGAYTCATQKSMLKKHSASQSDRNSLITMDKISNCPIIECDKENHLIKAKKDYQRSASSKSMEKTCWIFHYPYSKLELLKWKTVLDVAVKKLQGAIIQIKTEEAKLKKEGFNKQLILRHYNDPKDQAEANAGPLSSQYFWLKLLKGRPQMPAVKKADPVLKKFHYALVDGSSMIYYPSGRIAVCQSYSALPWGGMYTNIFSDFPDQVVLGTFTPFGCGSISFPKGRIISMMFNEDGGIVISHKGNIVREWTWPSKGKLDDPVEISVNMFITVKISGRFAITLFYKWHPQTLKLSLAPVKHKSFPPGFPEMSFPDVNPVSKEARELLKAYRIKFKIMNSTTWVKDPSSLRGPVDTATFDTVMDISPMSDIVTVIKLRRLEKKAKHILFNWLDFYKFSLGMESLYKGEMPKFPPIVVRKQKVSPAETPLKAIAKGKDENKEYLLYRNTFLKLKGVFKPLPLPCIQKTRAINQPCRLPLPVESKDLQLASDLVCPVALRRMFCGKEGFMCRCSAYNIPEVTDLEYDHLISKQLSSTDQIIIVYIFSTKEKDRTITEVTKVYREQNKTRSMPCTQSRLDSFRFLKYNIISAPKYTDHNCPLLVQRHNVIPGIFLNTSQHSLEFKKTPLYITRKLFAAKSLRNLNFIVTTHGMYIRGKLLFANFIFNGYSTSAKDLQKQIVKTRGDYHMGYFLPSDFRIR